MAGINLTPQRRSQLLELLLSQQAQRPQIQTGLEAALRLGAQGVRQKGINKLNEREATQQQKLVDVLSGTQRFEQIEGGPPALNPQKINSGNVMAERLAQLPIEQQVQAAQLMGLQQALGPKPEKPTRGVLNETEIGDEVVTQVVNPVTGEVIKELGRGPRRTEQVVDTAEGFRTGPQLGKLQVELNDQVAAVNAFGSQAQRLLKVVRDTEGANTLTAQLANVGNRIRNEVKTFANTFKVEFESGENAFNPEKYEGVFSAAGLAGANTRVKNGYLALAIQRAIASGLGSGRALSDKDIESQLVTLGRNQSDPSIIANIFQDSFQSVSDNVRFRSEAQSLKLPEIKEFDFGASGSANAARSFLDELRRSRERNASGDTTN